MKKVGVLALQGDFEEHAGAIIRVGASPVLVRQTADLRGIDALILPGGESTTMGIIARRSGLVEPLRRYIKSGKPAWGTCAGMILLADHVDGQKQDGQTTIGGLDITVQRNFFGRQLQSFETELLIPEVAADALEALFIRAPGIIKIGPHVTVLASYQHEEQKIPVAVRQGNILATSFHTEITNQNQLYKYFLSFN